MNRSTLHDLLTRYTANLCTNEELQFVESWYELIGEPFEPALSEVELQELEVKIWNKLRHGNAFESKKESDVRPLWQRLRVALTAIAAAMAIAWGVYWYQHKQWEASSSNLLVSKQDQTKWQQHYNKTDTVKEIILPDGSKVELAPRAQLAVYINFNQQNRNVRLLGDATFDVKRNAAMPFVVYSGDIITKVLGTRFRIRSTEPHKKIEVLVQSGKVTVYRQYNKEASTNTESNGVILSPNQKVTYFPDNHQFAASLTENPQPVDIVTSGNSTISLMFEETPLGEILGKLEEIYGIEIELDREVLANCPFTGNLTQKKLYTKLDLLCGAINGTYEIMGTKILITGKGCL